MATVEQIIKTLQKDYKPDEHLLVIYWDKKLVREWAEDSLEELQEKYKLTDKEVNEVFDPIWEYVTDDSYDTEEVGDRVLNSLTEGFAEWEIEQDTVKEDTQLWDKE